VAARCDWLRCETATIDSVFPTVTVAVTKCVGLCRGVRTSNRRNRCETERIEVYGPWAGRMGFRRSRVLVRKRAPGPPSGQHRRTR
jgi:hypothetical protein